MESVVRVVVWAARVAASVADLARLAVDSVRRAVVWAAHPVAAAWAVRRAVVVLVVHLAAAA